MTQDLTQVQLQLQSQLDALNAQINSSIPDKIKQTVIANRDKLQQWYSSVVSGAGISDADLAQLENDLTSAKKTELAASASSDKIKLIAVVGGIILVVIVIAWITRKHKLKT